MTIKENGDVHAEEELTYYFDGDYRGVYRTLSKTGTTP
ncbi:DUF2207 domain-containing protein [Clostridium thermarum]|nr:DUF2207 domain-containing protein [Clostridium thermarum]